MIAKCSLVHGSAVKIEMSKTKWMKRSLPGQVRRELEIVAYVRRESGRERETREESTTG